MQALARGPLRRSLVVPVGFALVVVTTQLALATDRTAELAAPLVVGLAVVGGGLSLPGRPRRRDAWAAAAGLAAFAAFAAPVVLSGEATFAGYIKLDDTATYLAMTDWASLRGPAVDGLPPSTYEATLETTLALGYPLGALGPLAAGSRLVGTDPAWLFQPYLAFLGATLALALYALTAGLVRAPGWRAAAAVVSSLPALLYGYVLWGGIKEIAAAALVALCAALAPSAAGRGRLASVAPLAVGAAALVSVLSAGGVVWLVPLAGTALAVAWLGLGRREALSRAALFVAVAGACALPVIVSALTWLPKARSFTESQLGNLSGPLSLAQVAGIWPVGDFRARPEDMRATWLLVAVTLAAAGAGLAWSLRRRSYGLPAYAASVALGALVYVGIGSPWVAAKALVVAGPAVVLAALAGAGWIASTGRRVEAALVGAAIAGGVLWSDALAYREAWLAPRGQLAELEAIGARIAGDAPTLMTDYQPYGARHFLRDADPEGASELRRRYVRLRDGGVVPPGESTDVDALALDGVLTYRTLVLRRSPAGSRPPSPYRLASRGRWYDVWQRDDAAPAVLEHVSLGSGVDAGAPPACTDVRRLAGIARAAGGRLAYVERAPAAAVPLGTLALPAGWVAAPDAAPAVVYPRGSGALAASFAAPLPGAYEVWLGGSTRGRTTVLVDGRPVGSVSRQLEHSGNYTLLGRIPLARGEHSLELRYTESALGPATTGPRSFALGPVLLTPTRTGEVVALVEPDDADGLCSRRLDWLEAIGG